MPAGLPDSRGTGQRAVLNVWRSKPLTVVQLDGVACTGCAVSGDNAVTACGEDIRDIVICVGLVVGRLEIGRAHV